jgi:hypothetical protein
MASSQEKQLRLALELHLLKELQATHDRLTNMSLILQELKSMVDVVERDATQKPTSNNKKTAAYMSKNFKKRTPIIRMPDELTLSMSPSAQV